MSKTGSAAKVKLNSFDDLFGTEKLQTGTEQVQEHCQNCMSSKDTRLRYWMMKRCRKRWKALRSMEC